MNHESTRPAGRSDWLAFGRLLKRANIPWLLVACAFVLSLVSARLAVLFPDYSIQFFEEGDITKQTVITGIGILVLAAVFSIAQSFLEAWLRTDISRRLRDTVLKKVFALRLSDVNRMNPRELISRTANDTGMLSDFIVTIFMVIAGEVTHFFFALQQIYSYDRSLFLFQLLFVPLSILSHWIQGRFSYKYQYGIQLRLSRLTEYLSELLVNIPLIKIFTREDDEIENGNRRIDAYAKIRTKSAFVDVIFSLLEELLRLGNRIFAILYGGFLVHRGTIDIGTWIAYFMLAEQASMTLDIIAAQWPVLKGVQGSISRTAEIVDSDDEEYEGNEIENEKGDFTLQDYSLSLGNKEILKGLTTTLKRKRCIAIVGRSGSGKSTLLNAMVRFYDPDQGRLTMGSLDVRTFDLNAYRRQFAYVFQDVRLFSETLRYNLCYGTDRQVEDAQIIDCCHRAGLDDFLKKQPNGLDSIIEEGGSNVSGGELQRIGIVRALLRDSDVLLLDEATANLDAATEHSVMDAIAETCADKTILMVAHRLDLVRRADHIIFMEDGHILAEGSHEELLAQCPSYRAMVEDTFAKEGEETE